MDSCLVLNLWASLSPRLSVIVDRVHLIDWYLIEKSIVKNFRIFIDLHI